MRYEIQSLKKYIVENTEIGTTIQSLKNNGEQLIRIIDYIEPVVAEEIPTEE